MIAQSTPRKVIPTPSVIDAHVNVASRMYIPQEFIEGQASNAFARFCMRGESVSRDRIYDMVFSIYEDHLADGLVEEMDEAGIQEAVLLAPDFTNVAKCALNAEEVATAHHNIMTRHPGRFHVFFGADPRHGPDGIALFERCVTQYGFKGLKLYPPCGYSPSDPALYPYFEICEANRIPVLTHTGPGWQALNFELGLPILIDGASRAFPNVNFILGHGAVTYVEESSYLCMYRSNIYMDLSGITAVASPNGWPAHLNEVFRTGMNHKLVFGSSWPAFRLTTSLAAFMNHFEPEGVPFAGVKRADRRLIMGGNMTRLLGGAIAARGATP